MNPNLNSFTQAADSFTESADKKPLGPNAFVNEGGEVEKKQDENKEGEGSFIHVNPKGVTKVYQGSKAMLDGKLQFCQPYSSPSDPACYISGSSCGFMIFSCHPNRNSATCGGINLGCMCKGGDYMVYTKKDGTGGTCISPAYLDKFHENVKKAKKEGKTNIEVNDQGDSFPVDDEDIEYISDQVEVGIKHKKFGTVPGSSFTESAAKTSDALAFVNEEGEDEKNKEGEGSFIHVDVAEEHLEEAAPAL